MIASVIAHFFVLIWWPVNKPIAESILSAVTELNLEVINLAPLPEPLEILRPSVPDILPVEELSEGPAVSSADTAAVGSLETESLPAESLRFDAFSIQQAVSAVELSSSPDADRAIPANELSFPQRSGVVADQTFINAQGSRVIIVDGTCFIESAQADDITHGKQVMIQVAGGGCPYVPSLSEKMVKNLSEKVCSRFGCN